MANNRPAWIPGLAATGDLSSHQYKAVRMGSTANTVKVIAGINGTAVGFLQNDPTDGQGAAVAGPGGVATALAGAADIAAGEILGVNTSGQVVDHTTDNRKTIALALEASTAVGDEIKVEVLGVARY